MASDDPAIFLPALDPSHNKVNGRLPRITQRDEFTLGVSVHSGPGGRAGKPVGSSREPPVASCFRTHTASTGIRSGVRLRDKAAPLQAVELLLMRIGDLGLN